MANFELNKNSTKEIAEITQEEINNYFDEMEFEKNINIFNKNISLSQSKKEINKLIKLCEGWIGQLNTLIKKMSTIINDKPLINDDNIYEQQKQYNLLLSVIYDIIIHYKKGEILINKIRVATNQDATEVTKYNILLSVGDSKEEWEELLLDIPQVLRATSANLKGSHNQINTILDVLKNIQLDLRKNNFKKIYGEDKKSHIKMSKQMQKELQEGYSILVSVYGEFTKLNEGPIFESLVNSLSNYKDFINACKTLKASAGGKIPHITDYVTIEKKGTSTKIEKIFPKTNSKKDVEFYEKNITFFNFLKQYSKDNVPSSHQNGDKLRYFTNTGYLSRSANYADQKIWVELKNLNKGGADLITGNHIITVIGGALNNLKSLLIDDERIDTKEFKEFRKKRKKIISNNKNITEDIRKLLSKEVSTTIQKNVFVDLRNAVNETNVKIF